MLDRPSAQALIDGLAAVALGAAVCGATRPAFASPLRPRLAFTFGGLCLFFGGRAASAALNSSFLSISTEVVACALPVSALVLAEGLLRRHAPTLLKALVSAAGLAVAVAVLITRGQPMASDWALGTYVVLTLSAVTVWLIARDRASLSRQENAGVTAVLACAAVLTLLSVTDFLPGAPLGLSGLGAAMVAYAVSAKPSTSRDARWVLSNLILIFALTGLAILPLAAALGLGGEEMVRLSAIVLATLLAVSAVVDAPRRTGGSARGFALALAAAETTSLDGFLGGLADQPLLAGLRVAEGGLLSDYDQPALAAAMAARPVWTPAALNDAHVMASRARDELNDLMTRTEATHALLISAQPVRIALLTLPGAGPTDEVAADLALFRKLAAVAAEDKP